MRDAYERRIEMMRIQNLEDWRRARMIAFYAMKPHMKNQNLSITDFLPLEGDHETVVDKEQEAQEIIEYYQKRGWLNQGTA